MKGIVMGALCVLITGSVAAALGPVDLYSFDDVQLSASGSTTRAQHFSPTESTPNALLPTDLFDWAALGIVIQGNDTLGGTLSLYTWNTNYATTKLGAALASAPVSLTGPGSGSAVHYIPLTPAVPLSASGQYMIELAVTSYGATGTSGWGLERSNSNDGGTNNDAFNNGSLQTNREYQVRLNVVPEPATLSLLIMGLAVVARRKR